MWDAKTEVAEVSWESFHPQPAPTRRVHVDEPGAVSALAQAITAHLERSGRHQGVVVLCIGTDRSTGDALGPLAGSKLAARSLARTWVYGTLDQPVHATNLHEALSHIATRHRHSTVIAVDACLGRTDTVGTVCVRPGPLQPGTGVHKKLPPAGDFHITGIVNVGGFMEYFVLQNTRLSLVMRMADIIAQSLLLALASRRVAAH